MNNNFKSWIGLTMGVLTIALVSKTAIAQTGNQSDITGPTPINQSDVTGTNPLETPDVLDNEPLNETNQTNQTNQPVSEDGTTETGQPLNNAVVDSQSDRSPYELYLPQLDVEGREDLEVDRRQYELYLQQLDVKTAVELIEEYQAVVFQKHLGIELFGAVPSADQICVILSDLWQVTGQKSALIYVSALFDRLQLIVVWPKCTDRSHQSGQLLASYPIVPSAIEPTLTAQSQVFIQRFEIPEVSREQLLTTGNDFRLQITDPLSRRSAKYLTSAQQLYQWLIAPIAAELEAEKIDNLVFSMDSGLRSLPLAALHSGERFLIEQYGVTLIPSFGLTDISYVDVRNTPILVMGASEFTELNNLPAVPVEMRYILRNPWEGRSFLNSAFTVENFKTQNQNQKFGIIHLATHAEFKPGSINQSYIQFYDRPLGFNQLRQVADELGWSQTENPPIELLVLSACRTAVGSPEAELGFAGLAVQTGVKSALASLWYVSDTGTLALMNEFYHRLSEMPIKPQALRQTQIAMIEGDTSIEDGWLRLSNGEMLSLTPELTQSQNQDLSHPYFWSAFIAIGNWN